MGIYLQNDTLASLDIKSDKIEAALLLQNKQVMEQENE